MASLSFSTAPPPWGAGAPPTASDGPNVGSPVRGRQVTVDVGASVTGREVARAAGTPPPPARGAGPQPSVSALLDGIAALKDLAATPASPPPPEPSSLAAVDAPAAYAAGAAAGERAALLRAFRETLPSREALGALAAAIRHLDARAGVVESTARSAGAGAAAALATATAASARLAALEAGPVRDLQAAALAAVPDRLSSEFAATLAALSAAVEEGQRSSAGLGLARGARWAAATVGGLVDAAGGTAVALSARFLLDGRSDGSTSSASTPEAAAARARARALLGGGLFLAAVELAWAAHKAAPLRTPRPLAGGLRRVRAVGWGAALVLGLGAVRSVCFSAADAALGAALGNGEGAPADRAGGEEEEAAAAAEAAAAPGPV